MVQTREADRGSGPFRAAVSAWSGITAIEVGLGQVKEGRAEVRLKLGGSDQVGDSHELALALGAANGPG